MTPTERETLAEINDAVDTDLSDAIRKTLTHGTYSITTVQATLAFVLADAIGQTCFTQKIPEERMCALAACYEAYVHNAAHAIYDGFAAEVFSDDPRKKPH